MEEFDGPLIRSYEHRDYEMVKSWWHSHNLPAPTVDMIPEDTSYIIEYEETPLACISWFGTNASFALIDNLVANPDFQGALREVMVDELIWYVETEAKEEGYNKVFCFTEKEKLADRYRSIGYQTIGNDCIPLGKRL